MSEARRMANVDVERSEHTATLQPFASEHTNSSVVAARARAIEAAQRLALPSSRGEVTRELVTHDESLQGRSSTPKSASSSHPVAVVLDQRDSNSGKRKQRTASHSRSMARCSWAFLPRCETPRRWRADETGDRGAPVPTGNRRARRARAGRRQVAQGRGPHRKVGAPCAADYGQQSHVNAPGGSGGLPPATVHTCKHFDRAQETCGEHGGGSFIACDGTEHERRPVYPRQRWNVWAWRRRVTNELDALVAGMQFGPKRKGLSHRARKLASCGTVVKVRECGCGEARCGSARYVHPSDELDGGKAQKLPHPCEARSCWLCQRRRASKLRKWLTHQTSAEVPEGYAWRFLTIAPQYAPDDPSELDPRGLRARLDALRAAVRAVMREGRSAIKGAFVAFELAGTGHVHAHALVLSRYLDHAWIDRVAARAGGREVHVAIELARGETPAEVAKYVTKLISPLDEAALTGEETREMIAPALCAAWEVATFGARMHERLGHLRGAPGLDDGTPPEPKDSDESCHACGTVGDWRWSLRATRSWVRECHARGKPAFDASAQLASRARQNVSAWDECFNGAHSNPIPTRARSRRAR